MDDKKTDESVKAGMQSAADATPNQDTNEEQLPVIEGEKDLDEIMHDQTREGNIENVEGEAGHEKDVDDLLHKLPATSSPETGFEAKEEDIDDLIHRK